MPTACLRVYGPCEAGNPASCLEDPPCDSVEASADRKTKVKSLLHGKGEGWLMVQ